MIKVAVASEGEEITQHFGYCTHFNIYDTEKGEIISVESVANPGHKPGFLPAFLHDLGVNTIISGGMGVSAVNLFSKNNIEVIVGASGKAEDAVKQYLAGELKSTGSVCHVHQHEGE